MCALDEHGERRRVQEEQRIAQVQAVDELVKPLGVCLVGAGRRREEHSIDRMPDGEERVRPVMRARHHVARDVHAVDKHVAVFGERRIDSARRQFDVVLNVEHTNGGDL